MLVLEGLVRRDLPGVASAHGAPRGCAETRNSVRDTAAHHSGRAKLGACELPRIQHIRLRQTGLGIRRKI